MEEKETSLTNAESLIEELSDEVLADCVGGTGGVNSQGKETNYHATNAAEESGIITNPDGSVRASSDRNKKEHFLPVDRQQILAGVAVLPIETWNYKEQNPQLRHIGPMAQDFAAVFGVGESDQYINMVDANGVALAAIQALYKMLLEKDATISMLRADFDDLKQQVIDSKAETKGKTTMETQKTTLTNSASLMEELADEVLTACVGGASIITEDEENLYEDEDSLLSMLDSNNDECEIEEVIYFPG